MRTVFASVMVAGLCCAQQPAFDAASVKVFVATPGVPPSANVTDPGRIHRGRAPMVTLLTEAYGVASDQISGPGWISDFMGPDVYTIDATMPAGTTKEQAQLMLQNLLVERFHLTVHRETRSFPGYELSVSKGGLKMKEEAPDPSVPADAPPARPTFNADGSFKMPPGPSSMTTIGTGSMKTVARQKPITTLTQGLGSTITQALGTDMMDLSAPKARVVDKTGLTGTYTFTVQFACEGCRGLAAMAGLLPLLAARAQADAPATAPSEPAGGGLPNIFVAFEQQLGLKLTKVKDVQLDVIVVDHVDRVPAAN